jgi:ribosomal protein S18 acetylase RimI-like enzyme
MIKISNVHQADLPAVVAIERAGFSPAEAGTPAAFQDRLNKLPDTFLVAKDGDRVVGFIVGPAVNTRVIDDQMYETAPTNLPTGGYQLVLSLATAPAYRGKGVGSKLLSALAQVARASKREAIVLDSLAKNVSFYEHNGFHQAGVSPSSHADETWLTMVKDL